MNGYFITATGTDIGKTFVTAGLIHQARKKEQSVHAVKPVLSGFDGSPTSDAHILLEALGKQATAQEMDLISPWRMKAALSPDMAAKREGMALPYVEILDHARPKSRHTTTFVEGVGGAFSPISENHLNVDFMTDLKLPVLLVTGSYLGAINHTLATLEALKARSVSVHTIILSQSADEAVTTQETHHALSKRTNVHILPLPRKTHWREAEELAVLL